MSRILSQAWREGHVRKGDEAIEQIYAMTEAANDGSFQVTAEALNAATQSLATLAQAHYVAANVRAKDQRAPQQDVPSFPGSAV